MTTTEIAARLISILADNGFEASIGWMDTECGTVLVMVGTYEAKVLITRFGAALHYDAQMVMGHGIATRYGQTHNPRAAAIMAACDSVSA